MTIEFNCPKCNSVIAFADKHAGKRAQCTTCNQKFFIPDKSFAKVQKVKPPKEIMSDPVPGFYRAALIDNWKVFFNPKNITGMAFIFVAVVFHFLTANLNFMMSIPTLGGSFINIPVYLGFVCRGIAWGFLFWYYREIIYATAFDQEDFPEVNLEGFYSFCWKIISSFYTLLATFLVVGLPAVIIYIVLDKIFPGNSVLLVFLFSFGLFLLPIAIMNIAIGKDLMLLRLDFLFQHAFRDFMPYMVIYILLSAAIFVQMFAKQCTPSDPYAIGFYSLLNIVSQLMFIFAIRAIGLFYRHYGCHASW